MAESFFSPNWYRVAGLRPRLRNHVVIHRHVVRDAVWYILQDDQSGNFFRIAPAAYRFLAGMDGKRTVNEIWQTTTGRSDDDHVTQDEVIMFLAQLHRSDMLTGANLPDVEELVERAHQSAQRLLMNRVRNPLAMRFPLIDPDRFLSRLLPLVGWLFSPLGFVLWLAFVGYALLLAAIQWDSLTHNIVDRVVSLNTLAFFIVLYPLMKTLHELGHGLAVKAWGGQVHEMGVMFLVFMPVPYVEASAASGFRRRWRRAVVSGIGIMVELALAALAMLVWSNAEPGVVRAAAFNVMLIGGVSTLLFNGNPLLRFDGYYVLCDVLDIPNLATRANRYLQYLVQRYAFGKRDAESPVTARGERTWFVLYGILSFIYRLFVMVAISLFVASRFFFIGVILAGISIFIAVVLPLWKGLSFVFRSNRLGQRQQRAKGVTLVAIAITAAAFFLVPAPNMTVSQGVVWLPTQGRVVATNSGFITQIDASSGSYVDKGQLLVSLADPELDAQIALLEAQAKEYQARFENVNLTNPAKARIFAEQLARTRASLAFWQGRKNKNRITAQQSGRFVLPEGDRLLGHLVPEGRLLGYVFSEAARSLRVVVPQARINDVRQDSRSVSIRFPSQPGRTYRGEIMHVTPASLNELPSAVLGPMGGGGILLDPEDKKTDRPIQNYYAVDIRVDEASGLWRAEERAVVRFSHAPQSLGLQFLRAVRDVFLRRFSV